MSAWVRWDSFGYFSRIIDFEGIILFNSGTTNTLVWWISGEGDTAKQFVVANAVELNTWTHIVASVETSGNMHLFKNGIELKCTEGSACDTATGRGTNGRVPKRIHRSKSYIGRAGGTSASTEQYLHGSLSYLTVVDGYALTAEAEVVELMLATTTITATTTTSTSTTLCDNGLVHNSCSFGYDGGCGSNCGGGCGGCACAQGFHSPTGLTGCTACTEHTYQNMSGFRGASCEAQPVCGVGTKFPGKTDSNIIRGDCIPCDVGTFQSKGDHYDTECEPCPANTYSDGVGGVVCTPQPTCGRGERISPSSTAGMQTCIPCDGNIEYQNVTDHRKEDCIRQPSQICGSSESFVPDPAGPGCKATCNGTQDPPACFFDYQVAQCIDAALGEIVSMKCPAMCEACDTMVPEATTTAATEQELKSEGGGGGTAAAVVITLLVLAGAIGVYVWYDRRSKQQQQQQQARDAVLGGGEVLEMIENPPRRAPDDSAGGGVAAAVPAVPASAGGVAPIYAPPAWIPPAQDSPTYYSDVAAAPGTLAEYAAPNELGGSAVYGGGDGGGGGGHSAAAYASPNEGAVYGGGGGGRAAAYASPNEAGSAVYEEEGSGAPITNAGGMYASTGSVGGADDGAIYTNDAYGNVPGSTTTNA